MKTLDTHLDRCGFCRRMCVLPDESLCQVAEKRRNRRTLKTQSSKEQMKTKFHVWRPVTIGNGLKNIEDFKQKWIEKQIDFSEEEMAKMIQDPAFTVSPTEQKLQLARISISDGDLGEIDSDRDLSFEQICQRAENFGLEMCPPEVGPQIRWQYQWPEPNVILIAAPPIKKKIFCIYDGQYYPDDSGMSRDEKPLFPTKGPRVYSIGSQNISPSSIRFCHWVFVVPKDRIKGCLID